MNDLLRTRLGYLYQRTPPAAGRPVIESTLKAVELGVTGEVIPLLETQLRVGYASVGAPRAAAGGASYKGPTAVGRLSKEFTRVTRVTLEGGRSVYVSGFEQNAFYLSDSVQLTLDLRLPMDVRGHVGVGYRVNSYRTEAVRLGVPRQDEIFGWAAGLARDLTRWSFLRLDYQNERRDSNLEALDNRNRTLMIQLGIDPWR